MIKDVTESRLAEELIDPQTAELRALRAVTAREDLMREALKVEMPADIIRIRIFLPIAEEPRLEGWSAAERVRQAWTLAA